MSKDVAKKAPSTKPHYVSNKEFTAAVIEYTNSVRAAKAAEEPIPVIPRYIGECFMKITSGLASKGNYTNYSWKDEMITDALFDCIRAIMNYDPETKTRTGKPNAFGYFTQITQYAFWRRIAKENKQQTIKENILKSGTLNDFADFDSSDNRGESIIERMRIQNAKYNVKGKSYDYIAKEAIPTVVDGWVTGYTMPEPVIEEVAPVQTKKESNTFLLDQFLS